MSDPPQPIAPFLAPIAEAFDAADAAARAARAEEAQREEDRQSIRRAFKRGGFKMAVSVGSTYGWSRDEVEALFRAPAEPEDGGDGDDGEPPVVDPDDEDGDEEKRKWTRIKHPIKALPPDCPVIPLGKSGGHFHYLDPSREYVALRKHGADELRGLFAGRNDWLWAFMPKFNEKNQTQTGWKADRTADSLMDACGKIGIFDPAKRLRGVGAWRGDDGGLVLHAGDVVYFGGEWREPGYLGEHVYPGQDRLPRPADEPAPPASASTLLNLFNAWPWEQDAFADADVSTVEINGAAWAVPSVLLLGWAGCAMVGGALDWRPMMWITGDAGSGKSTLQKVIQYLMGPALVASSDATSAGIYQAVGYSSRAAAIDEAEADPNSLKMKNMVDLVRQSASGGKILRGSNDAKFKGFEARSTFLLSSIIVPPLNTADLTRITILSLGRLKSITPPRIDGAELLHLGRQLRRRVMDGWGRWQETLDVYRQALALTGHDARGCDQFGALLAMADVLLFDAAADSDTVALLAAACGKAKMLDQQEEPSNAEAMLNWLISIPLDVFRGGTRMTIGTLVAGAADIVQVDGQLPVACARALEAHGVFVQGLKDAATVTLPNQHAGLAQLFDRSVWATSPGAATSGWSQAMRRLSGAQRVNSRRLGGRGVSIPVRIFLRQDEGETR
ncbi:hypothetical protein [Chelatococcus asaccharovorans]|uniref:DNA primase/helicase n=1 Tax=Chelatococcus asaccharovorans TaxID=28210 RepID=A0A2V3UDE2_9HYPH|nr:hypothetical protein [Chelatococcus asaccharovorans]MBS7703187.1 hypothetical protein [Chelatococcus asaccharovorans]PXW61516.1 hypothetical protein C7450_10331 [Chelatococcus asaccharovorans]